MHSPLTRTRWIQMAGLAALVAAAACGSKEDASDPKGAGPDAGDTNAPPSFGTNDAGGEDDASPGKCQTLNIGIFGVPGENDSANFQQWLANAGTTTMRVQTNANDVVTADVLAPFDVVILDHLRHEHSGAEAEVFKTWLSSGKGAMSMTGYLDQEEIDFLANPLLHTVGLEYANPWLNGPVTTFVPHPINQGITDMTFLGGYAVNEVDGSTATRTAIASINQTKVGYTAELGQGRAFVWGDEWIEFDTEWTELPQVQQFWVNIFSWLAPNRCKLTPKVK